MSYYGVVLLLSGYQANEKAIMEQYEVIVAKCVLCGYFTFPSPLLFFSRFVKFLFFTSAGMCSAAAEVLLLQWWNGLLCAIAAAG